MKSKFTGQFVKEPKTTEERMEQLGVDCWEMMVLRLVIFKEYTPAFAVRFVRERYGVHVDVKELHAKLNPQ
jgi:hypothetical protein